MELLIGIFLFIWFIGIGLEISAIKQVLKKINKTLEKIEKNTCEYSDTSKR